MNGPPSESTIEPAPARASARYVALLVTAATVVLIVGAYLRPKAQATAVRTNELATLPELSQRRMLRDIASYLTERVAIFASSVVYLPTFDASGLVLGRDSVLTASLMRPGSTSLSEGSGQLVLAASPLPGDSTLPAARILNVDSLALRWILVVARRGDRPPLVQAGLSGGLIPVQCGDLSLRELLFNTVVPLELRGAGVFDLDGNALALAVPCNSRIALVPLVDALRALQQQRTPEYHLWSRYGLRVTAHDSLTRRVLAAGSGPLVTEVLLGGPADRAGLWPGDVIRMALSRIVAEPADLASLLDATTAARIAVRRGGHTRNLVLNVDPAAGTAAGGSSRRLPGADVMDVTPGSRAERAGLRPGDRVLQINQRRSPTSESLQQALAGNGPVFLVVERDRRRRSLVLR